MTPAITESALIALAATVDHVQHLVGALENAVIQLARGETVEDLPPVTISRDHIWACKSCGRRLAVHDRAEDVLLIKYKDLYVRFHVGAGGYVETLCLSCGRTNRADYEPG